MLSQFSFGQIRIIEADPTNQTIKIKNFGTSEIDISSYWICARRSYGQISSMTILNGDFNLSEDEEVEFTSSVTLNSSSSDLGIYSSNSFGSSTAMLDFLQWGQADFSGRENVAVTKGIWETGDFIITSSPYVFTGTGTETGISFWESSVLSINDNSTLNFGVYPNPSSEFVNIQLPSTLTEGKVTVYDFTGKTVGLYEISDINKSFQINHLQTGNYFIKVVSNNEVGIKKFIKK